MVRVWNPTTELPQNRIVLKFEKGLEMKTTYVFKPFSVLIILILLLGGVFTGGVPRASADGSPWIAAFPTNHLVRGQGWPIGIELTLTIGDYSAKTTTIICPWDETNTIADFDLTGQMDLNPGDVVTVTDGKVPIKLTIPNLAVTNVDISTNKIYGTGNPGDPIVVAPDQPAGDRTNVTVDGNGNWSASLVNGSEPIVLQPGYHGWAAEHDEVSGGGWIYAFWSVPNYRIDVWVQLDEVDAFEWTIGEPLTLTVGGQSFSITKPAAPGPWDPNSSYTEFHLSDIYEIKPGDEISLTNGIITKTTVVTYLDITDFDVVQDTVSGIAAPNFKVDLWACDVNNCFGRHVVADGNGVWSADFANPGIEADEQNTIDILPGTWLYSSKVDEDTDSTTYGWYVPNPTSGSATGEGWFNSPAGAYAANPAFAGKATFEFEAKYHEKSAKLTGSVQFSFKGFSFQSTSFDWMAIEGGRMQLTGSGKINGKGEYGFMINTASGGGKDTFRIRIWNKDTGEVVYDNMLGEADSVIPIALVHDGSIKLKP